jgi:hypothetical protein
MKPKWPFLSLTLTAFCLGALLPAGRCQIVGYKPMPVAAGYNFLANPFDTGDNSLTSVISPSYPPLGTAVFLWNTTNQQYDAPAVYTAHGWSPNLSVPPGIGFVISSASSWTLTFSGNILTGTRTNFYAGEHKLSLLGSCFPIGEALTGPTMAFPALDSQNVFLYDSARQDFLDPFTYFSGYGWFDPSGAFGAAGPVIGVGRSFFAQNLGPSTVWVQSYQGPALQTSEPASLKVRIQSIHADAGQVTLSILNPGGTTYSLQFSPDQCVWHTLASNQTGTTWTGPVPDGPQGFYRLATP